MHWIDNERGEDLLIYSVLGLMQNIHRVQAFIIVCTLQCNMIIMSISAEQACERAGLQSV